MKGFFAVLLGGISVFSLAAGATPPHCRFPHGRRVFTPDEPVLFHLPPLDHIPDLRIVDFNGRTFKVHLRRSEKNVTAVLERQSPGMYWILDGERVMDAFAVFSPAPVPADPESTRFGVFHAYTDDNYAHYNVRRELDMLRRAHLFWVRATTFMTPCLHSGGDWHARDQFIDDLRTRGLVLLSMFEEMNFPKTWKPLLTNPRTLEAIGDYITKERLTYFEVWNEVNNERSGTMEQYIEFQREFYREIRRINPDARIVATGLASPKFRGQWGAFLGPNYLDGLLAGGIDAWTDIYNFHYYPYQWKTQDILDQYMEVFHRYHVRKPIWVTENGMAADFTDIPAQKKQAAYLVRSAVTCLAAGVAKYFWFLSRDHPAFAYGLLTGDLKPKAAYVAYGVLARLLGDSTYNGSLPSTDAVTGYRFTAGDREIRVLWTADASAAGRPAIPVPSAASVLDIMGRNVTPGPDNTIRVGQSPLFLVVHTPKSQTTK